MLGVAVFGLGGPQASEALGVEAGKEFDPGSATLVCIGRPPGPGGLLDKAVYVVGEARLLPKASW